LSLKCVKYFNRILKSADILLLFLLYYWKESIKKFVLGIFDFIYSVVS